MLPTTLRLGHLHNIYFDSLYSTKNTSNEKALRAFHLPVITESTPDCTRSRGCEG